MGLAQSQVPESCKGDPSFKNKLVKSLYNPTTDPNIFTFIQLGQKKLTVNCTSIYKCTTTEINGKRWLAQYIDQLNIIWL
ncbi:hypothetical protein CDV26_04460 [Francisella halioticida]|uniref:Uncharacterized protein n=1 Tax=Francisella halioticida TaxID=549298 RepID=A0ABN5AVK5_9GAMM|nr:hypothetical protein [Francisella halioticida]ASG67740.1 hypothetical protein CDV26_04460 [Francisella halioticida]